MAKFQKGNGGRPKGTPNKLTATVKDTVLFAFNKMQEHPKANRLDGGRANPSLFYQIAAKLIPTEVNAKFEGKIINVIAPPSKKQESE